MPRVRILMIAEVDAVGVNDAMAILDDFRESAHPEELYGVSLYRATAEDIGPSSFLVAVANGVRTAFVPPLPPREV